VNGLSDPQVNFVEIVGIENVLNQNNSPWLRAPIHNRRRRTWRFSLAAATF
jgi:hypothetical protein